MNLRMSALIAFFAVVPLLWCASTDDTLLNELKSRPLGEVVGALKKGELAPPAFCFDKQLPKDRGKSFRAFLDKLRSERESSLRDAAKTDSYATLLSEFHAYLGNYDSYSALLLNDCVKRLLLEWAREKLRAGSDVKSRKMIGSLLAQTRLEPSRLKPFFGREARPEWIKGTADLDETSKRLFESYGYPAVSAGWPGIKRLLDEHGLEREAETLVVLREYRPLSLALRMLSVENYRASALEGTLEFLKRGGDIAKVDLNDVRYFDLIMGQDTCSKFGFQPFGKNEFDPMDMLIFLGRLPESRLLGPGPIWIIAVFK